MNYSMRRVEFTTLFLILLSISPFSTSQKVMAQSDKLDVKAKHLRGGQAEEVVSENTVHEQTRSLVRLYDEFMSIENHPREQEKRNRTIKGVSGSADRKEWVVPGMRVNMDTTLRDALVELERNSQNAYKYREISGQICLIPADSGEPLPSPLDKFVSYDCSNKSTEAAIDGLINEFNRQYPEEKITFQTNAEMYLERMPSPYYSVETVTLTLENRPIREALCELMGLAPLRLYYDFHTRDDNKGLPTHLLILCTNYKMPGDMVKPEFKGEKK